MNGFSHSQNDAIYCPARSRKDIIRTMAQTALAVRRRAVGVIRVSHVGKDRRTKGERFVSPGEQRQTIQRHCDFNDLDLVEIFEELDVKGDTPLAKRPGMRPAVERIERGAAEVIVVAYFDRLVRDGVVQRQILERVEGAGGDVLAVDVGAVSQRTASLWLSSSMLGMVAEYHRRITGEKVVQAKHDAVVRGVPPFPRIPLGYRRGVSGRLEVVPGEAPHVVRAFELRAGGASLGQIRAYLREHGIERSYRGIQTMLASRLVLGELHSDGLSNLRAHPAILERDLWQRVQRVRVSRGRRAMSTRILARLGILRCWNCGAACSAASQRHHKDAPRYSIYRCSKQGKAGDCTAAVTISAELAERTVITWVRAALAKAEESAGMETSVVECEAELARRQMLLDNAVAAFSGLDDVASAQQRLLELREAVHETRDRLENLRAASAPAVLVSGGRDWAKQNLSIDGQRALIKAVIVGRVLVRPGRGPERLDFSKALGQ
jgi:DNA invertase Pin-like site-specific DNA recombinase